MKSPGTEAKLIDALVWALSDPRIEGEDYTWAALATAYDLVKTRRGQNAILVLAARLLTDPKVLDGFFAACSATRERFEDRFRVTCRPRRPRRRSPGPFQPPAAIFSCVACGNPTAFRCKAEGEPYCLDCVGDTDCLDCASCSDRGGCVARPARGNDETAHYRGA